MSLPRVTRPGYFGPLVEVCPDVGEPCADCWAPLRVGDRPALIHTPNSAHDYDRRAAGLTYSWEARVGHERCPREIPTRRVDGGGLR